MPPLRQGSNRRITRGCALLAAGLLACTPSLAQQTPTAWQLLDDGDPDLASAKAAAYDSIRQRFVIVSTGGGVANGPDLTWELVGDDWVRRFIPEPTPRVAGGSCAAFDSDRGVVVLFGGVIVGVGTADETWEYDGSVWTQRSPANVPPARLHCSMVYDQSIQRVVMFGGYGSGFSGLADTWEYDGTDWMQVFPQSSPAARGEGAMAYDPVDEVSVLFGGRDGGTTYADTWEYDGAGSRWTAKNVHTTPSPRGGAGLAYDPVRGTMVLFGGYTPISIHGDTWEWNGRKWTELTPPSAPEARWRVRLAYDVPRGQVVAHGGATDNGAFNDTWAFDGVTWTRIADSGLPLNRAEASMVYDPRIESMVLYGGRTGTVDRDLWDTFHYTAGQWALQGGAGTPTASKFPLAYDPVGQRLVGFSGGPVEPQDLHEYRGASEPWVSTPTCCPDGRFAHAWTHAPSSGGVLMFGGRACCTQGSSYYYADDTWVLDGTTWIEKLPPSHPEARRWMGFTYDEAAGRAVLYGGDDGLGRKADTWAFDGQTWQMLMDPSPPGVRLGVSLAYDPVRGVIVLFGDGPPLEGVTWEFDGTQWVGRSTPFHPDSERCWAPMAYDPLNDVVMLFGGAKCGTEIYFSDTWAYGTDPDEDGIVGGLDNCRQTVNPDQANADGDVAGDACDCAAGDPGSFAMPVEVTNLHAEGAVTTSITWDDQAPLVGSAVVYDLVSGSILGLRADGGFAAATCLADDRSTPSYPDGQSPNSGDGFYYLVRSANACGLGTYGPGRAVLDASGPCP